MAKIKINKENKHKISPYLFMQFAEPLGTSDASVDAGWDFLNEKWQDKLVEKVKELMGANTEALKADLKTQKTVAIIVDAAKAGKAKKAPAKKAAPKKEETEEKKPAAKKATTKKTAETAEKKPAAKKTTTKKTAETAEKKPAAKKTTTAKKTTKKDAE